MQASNKQLNMSQTRVSSNDFLASIDPSPSSLIKELDFKGKRVERQIQNHDIVYDILITGDLKSLREIINNNQYERTLEYLNLTEEELILKCKDESFAKLLAMSISKKASRQGSKDETEQLSVCNDTAMKCGINIKNLTATECRPTKDGLIVSKDQMKTQGIKKDCCLKSFDGKITGKIIGFITAKVAYGNGGHQDNVFEEMDTVAEWWKNYKSKTEEILIVLIDTDLIPKLTRIKEKYHDVNNVKIFNHVEFQQYMISTYYKIN